MLRTLTTAIAVAALLATAATAAQAHPTPADRMVAKINDVRDRHGLRDLRAAPKLRRSSRGYARRLMRTNSFGHGSAYRGLGFARSGEILALRSGHSRRPRPALLMWMRSSGHRALLLSPSFRYVGASPVRGRFGGRPTTIWVVHFGAH